VHVSASLVEEKSHSDTLVNVTSLITKYNCHLQKNHLHNFFHEHPNLLYENMRQVLSPNRTVYESITTGGQLLAKHVIVDNGQTWSVECKKIFEKPRTTAYKRISIFEKHFMLVHKI
jgi:hypothetical protein